MIVCSDQHKSAISYVTTSFDLKLAVLQYYRFGRQCVCVDECSGADVIVDTGKEIIEVEVKISKRDLIYGERYKVNKHYSYRTGVSSYTHRPNRFLFCVPSFLLENAKKVVQELNPKYGILIFDKEHFEKRVNAGKDVNHQKYICIARSAKKLHNKYFGNLRWTVSKRISAKLISVMQSDFRSRSYFVTTKDDGEM